MANNSMTKNLESKISIFFALIIIIGVVFDTTYYNDVLPELVDKYDQRLRTEFHLPPNAKLIKLKDTRSGDSKAPNLDSYFIEAIVAFEDADFDRYITSLDDPQIWKPQLFSKSPLSKVYISENTHRWRNLPDAPYSGIPNQFGSRPVKWDRIEPPSEKANKYFCYALEPIGPEGQVLGTMINLKGYNCFISACADFPITKNPFEIYEGPVYPAGMIMGVLDYQTRRLHIKISPQDANWACRPRAAEDYLVKPNRKPY